jgi:hypothetical protein
MKEIHPAVLPPEAILAQCKVRRLRRSGPGGQHRNKVETAVALLHLPTGAKAEASERRSQAENRAAALFRLRVNLALEVRRPVEADSPPSPLWQSRRGGGKIHINESHEDFPAILAEALDVLSSHGADPKNAALQLGCSVSQLIKLLKQEPRAFLLANRWREERNLHRLQ